MSATVPRTLALLLLLSSCGQREVGRDDAARTDTSRADVAIDAARDATIDVASDAHARDVSSGEAALGTCLLEVSPSPLPDRYIISVMALPIASGTVELDIEGKRAVESPKPITLGAAHFLDMLPATPNNLVRLEARAYAANNALVARCQDTATHPLPPPPCAITLQPAPVIDAQGRSTITLPAGASLLVTVTTPGDEVELFIGGQSQGPMLASTGAATYQITLPPGALTLYAACRDTHNGASGTSATVQAQLVIQ